MRRKINEEKVDVQEIIDRGMVSYMIQYMNNKMHPHLSLEASWCISNICMSNTHHIRCIVDKGLVSVLPHLLNSKYDRIYEQSVWIIGNISADDDVSYKDMLLTEDIIDPMVHRLYSTRDTHIIKYTIWSLCNLVSGISIHSRSYLMMNILKVLCYVLNMHTTLDIDHISNILYAINNMNSAYVVDILYNNNNNIISNVLSCASSYKVRYVLYPSIQLFGTLSTSSHVQYMIDNKIVDALYSMILDHQSDVYVLYRVLWIVSNIIVDSFDHMMYIVHNDGWINRIVSYTTHTNSKIQKESILCMINVSRYKHMDSIDTIMQFDVLHTVHAYLSSHRYRYKMILYVIQFIDNIMTCHSKYHSLLEISGMIDTLESLLVHKDPRVYAAACRVIETHFEVEDTLDNI